MGSIEQPLEFWLQDLARRRTFVKPEHTIRGFFFNGILENLRTLGDEALVARCREACSQERFLDFFSYSVELLFPIFFTALPTLAERHGGAEVALRQIGQRASIDFLASVAGRALLMLNQARPQSLINSMPAAFRVGMSFGSSQVEWTGPRGGRLHAQCSYMPPPFHEGMVRQMLEAARARGIQAAARSTGELDIVCEFSWE
ncbi:TIGR02265 family protein [Archangium lansingense]|uniref:TIGR02265 family protein n=1 Tax=Archangium lansingense TaxID=2995310 RepID=A0ABT4A1H1_9BACT|nr:TIGR02265 family protein [Archangium lansinium]MCY1075216.1 TIGR02265 family protein [Archangium lansinium]